MRRKKVAFSFLIIILLMFLVIYFYIFFLNKNEENYNPKKDQNLSMVTVNENQYYIVYINANNGTGSSFVPLTLNPGLENDSNLNVSISFDDDGNIINNKKIIVIDNFFISEKNKEMIKEIAGIDNYNDALKEIEARVNDTKKNLEKEGLIK